MVDKKKVDSLLLTPQSPLAVDNGFRPQGGFQLRNPNPDFLDFSLFVEKGFAKLFS